MTEISGRSVVLGLVTIMLVAAMLPTYVDQVQGVNTTSWNFTGATGAATLWGLIPFIFIAGTAISFISDMLK